MASKYKPLTSGNDEEEKKTDSKDFIDQISGGNASSDGPSEPYEIVSTEQNDASEEEKAKRLSDAGPKSSVMFEERKGEVLVKWAKYPSATKYHIHIEKEKKTYNKVVFTEELRLDKKEYQLHNGKIFSLKVSAHTEKAVLLYYDEKIFIVGGNVVATHAIARLSIARPESIIEFNWNKPAERPEQYEVAIYKRPENTNVTSTVVGSTNHVFQDLNPVTEYYCTVTAIYKDKRGEVVISNYITTGGDVGKPSNLKVSWKNEHITVEWSPAKGAKFYNVKVMHIDGRKSLDCNDIKTDTTCGFKMNRWCRYGRTCTFTVIANGLSGRQEQLSDTIFIGGDYVVTNVVLVKTVQNPRRQLKATWNGPNLAPSEYKVRLFERNYIEKDKFNLVEVESFETELTDVVFSHLKTQKDYYCEVTAKYSHFSVQPGGGCYSNLVQTDAMIKDALEDSATFGMPRNIIHSTDVISRSEISAKISWTAPLVGENHMLVKYHITVLSLSSIIRLADKSILQKTYPRETVNIDVPNISKGQKYRVKVRAVIRELNSLEDKEYVEMCEFHTKPGITEIFECKCEGKVINFSWKPVHGAKSYTLIVKKLLSEQIIHEKESKVTETTNGCLQKVGMTNELRTGMTCRMKVIVSCEGTLRSESDWKVQLIGGETVPRNVIAEQCKEDPERSIVVKFDHPSGARPDCYKIISIPKKGREKDGIFHHGTNTIGYLQKGMQYEFLVHALYGETGSQGSYSNVCTTAGASASHPLVSIDRSDGGQVDLSRSTFQGSTTQVNMKTDDFGKVRDLHPKLFSEDNYDKLKVHWKSPSFNNNPEDYRVYNYILEFSQYNSENMKKKQMINGENEDYTYTSPEYTLELGETYQVTVTTFYEDIDKDKDYFSSGALVTVHSRPCKPVVISNSWANDELLIEWNDAKGAVCYAIQIFIENSKQPLFDAKTSKNTHWTRKFNEEFGFGTTYRAVITAFGSDMQKNSFHTELNTIGGDFVPRNVHGTIKSEKVLDQNTQAYLEWVEPKKKPVAYEVESNHNTGQLRPRFERNSCVVFGLKAGTYYTFKVFAIHVDRSSGKQIRSGGCSSNKIKTNPTPTQVKHVTLKHGQDPSTSILVQWGEVDAAKDDEYIRYRVSITSEDETFEAKKYIDTERLEIGGLVPGCNYSVTVAGGNSDGFGTDSFPVELATEYGTPRNVVLTAAAGSPASTLQLKFDPAVGNPLKYSACLMKKTEIAIEVVNPCEVYDGYQFTSLDPNTKYFAKINAIYKDGVGKPVDSCLAYTAPSRVVLSNYQCYFDGDQPSDNTFEIKWMDMPGCTHHEVSIKCEMLGSLERSFFVEKACEYTHTCMNAMTQYSAQVRSKNQSGFFGEWSEKVLIDLAPSALANVNAKLADEGNTIFVECERLPRDPQSYCMQIESDGKVFSDVLMATEQNEDNFIKFVFEHPVPATEYCFWVWGQDLKLGGKKTLTNMVTSRPAVGILTEVKRCDGDPSTEIQIAWEAQERCNEYEVSIQRQNVAEIEHLIRTDTNTFHYKCLSPGDNYIIKVRCLCNQVHGPWSEDRTIELAPAEVMLIEDGGHADQPHYSIDLRWKPLNVKPTGYLATLYCGTEILGQYKGNETKHVFKRELKAGSWCHCTVQAHKGDTLLGKAATSKMYKIIWSKPRFLRVMPDENEPSKRAKISWDKPEGVIKFKLEFENNQSGLKTDFETDKDEYVFESGIPGNTYTVRLYCGCDSMYDPDFKEEKMVMKPAAPYNIKVTTNCLIGGFEVEFQDNHNYQKQYEIMARPMSDFTKLISKKTPMMSGLLENLTPGESYKVSVRAHMGDVPSCEAFHVGYVESVPGEVKKIRSKYQDINTKRAILYEWEPLNIKPREYRIQWRCNDGPITEESTEKTSFTKWHLNPGSFYGVRVYAVNKSGSGPVCDWETFITDPSPPHSIDAYANPKSPETSLVIKFQDLYHYLKKYKVIATAKTDGKEVENTVDDQYAVLNGLVPGEEYSIRVVTLFCDKESKPAIYQTF